MNLPLIRWRTRGAGVSNNISRRALIAAAVASGALTILPTKLLAQGWEEALGALEAAGGVIEALNKLKDGKGSASELAAINAKLDALLAGQRQILQAIGDLRLFISEELFKQFRDAAEKTLLSLQNRYDFVRAGGYRKSKKREYAALADDIQDATNYLGQYDFSAFYTFVLGVAMSMNLRRTIRTPNNQMHALQAGFKQKVDAWLMPENDRGIVKGIEFANNDVEKDRALLNSYPKSQIIRTYPRRTNGANCEYATYLDISGSFETGFSGTTREVEGHCTPIMNRPCTSHTCLANPIDKALPSKLVLGSGPDYTGIPPLLAKDESPYPQVREANRLRNVLIADMRRVRDLEFLRDQMQRVSTTLGSA